MSFFGGLESSGAPPNQSKAYNFEETYDGLGEYGADDAFNNETFGVSEVGKNFDFSATTGSSTAPVQNVNQRVNQLSYAQAAANDEEFMKDLWGENPQQQNQGQPQQGQPQQPNVGVDASGKKVLSLSEIEVQLTQIDQSQRAQYPQMHQVPGHQPQYYPGAYPPPQYGGYMMPQGYAPPPPGQYVMPYPGYMPMQPPMGPGVPHHGVQGIPVQTPIGQPQSGFAQPQHPQQPQQPQHPQQVQPVHQPQQPQQVQQVQQQQEAPQAAHAQQESPQGQQFQQPQAPPAPPQEILQSQGLQGQARAQQAGPTSQPLENTKKELSSGQYPVLGSRDQSQAPQSQGQSQPQSSHSSQGQGHRNHFRQHVPLEDLLPEEQQRIARRHEKLGRILRYSGVMNPKDKDFVTRFQLSQIVTDDPYNEDFYAQVFKVVHPKSVNGALNTPEPNSIAQAYLDHSGHRLGGRHKRADVALQRMQQQVQKAVTVAKERQKLPQNVREGVLGKISVGSGKKPRQLLVILSKAAQIAEENEAAEGNPSGKKQRSPSMAAPSKPIKKYTKKDIMRILEEIINNLMSVESASRTSSEVDTAKLWESLHILDQPSSSGDEASFVNPFIQCLNYAKGLKILPRLFKFLTREQILTIVTLIVSNLENLTVIKDGSYTTYEDNAVPSKVSKLIETYTLTLSKLVINAVQDFKFHEIIGLVMILIRSNAVSFVSTTKIGLSTLTSLLSRAELMKGEGTISATDLSEWTSCYDELFTSLESRIAAVFPPGLAVGEDDYIWQFLATLSLGGKLSHQRIIVDEVRDEIFAVMNNAKAIDNSDMANLYKKQNMLNNLNMYLVVMGLVADENEIRELQS